MTDAATEKHVSARRKVLSEKDLNLINAYWRAAIGPLDASD